MGGAVATVTAHVEPIEGDAMDAEQSRLERYEARTQRPLAVAALLFLVVYAWPIINPDLPRGPAAVCRVGELVIWGLFIADYVWRLSIAEKRGAFMRANLLDLALIVLPMLRPLRALRPVVSLSALTRSNSSRTRIVLAVLAGAALVASIAALGVLEAERADPAANISGFGDALWWAGTTITTVGYGDRFPVTGEGRIVGFALMMAGISLLGLITASVASWFVSRFAQVEGEEEQERQALVQLAEEVRLTRVEIAELRRELLANREG